MPAAGGATEPVAILGANSRISIDFLLQARAKTGLDFRLYSRNPENLRESLSIYGLAERWPLSDYSGFGTTHYSAILNCVGVGDPARALSMGRDILAITRDYDELALRYVIEHPGTRYVFLSSGAVYGSDLDDPVQITTPSTIPVNRIEPQHYYGVAKLYAEALHRSRPELSIIDVRIFNYVSRRMDVNARFLIAEMIAAILGCHPFRTSSRQIVRDFLHPADLCELLCSALRAPAGTNAAIDAYSKACIGKDELIDLMVGRFGLKVQLVPEDQGVNASGRKNVYYSENHKAAQYGYAPAHSSASGIVEEVTAILSRGGGFR